MPISLREFNRRNGYSINFDVPFKYVTSLINNRRESSERDLQLKTYILNHFADEANKYERHRQETLIRASASPATSKLRAKASEMAGATKFLQGYIDMFNLMGEQLSKEKNIKFDPLPYFGLSGEDFTQLAMGQLNSYSYKDGRQYEIFKAYGVKNPRFMAQANEMSSYKENNVKYSTADETQKHKIHETYVTKTLMQEKLNSMNFFTKWIFSRDVRAMEGYIARADQLLGEVEFPTDNVPKEANDFAKQGYAISSPQQKLSYKNAFAKTANTIDEKLNPALVARAQEIAAKDKAEKDKLRQQQEEQMRKQEEENRVKQQAQEELKIQLESEQNDIDAANAKGKYDKFFQIKYRPPFDKKEYYAQYAEFKEIRQDVIEAPIPKEMQSVFYNNYRKFKEIKAYVDQKHKATPEQVKTIELKHSGTMHNMEVSIAAKVNKEGNPYSPKEYKDIENTLLQARLDRELKERLDRELKEKNKNNIISPKKEEVDKKKDPPVAGKTN